MLVGRPDRGPPEAVAEVRERVLGTEEVPALADLDVRVVGEAGLVDRGRRELLLQQLDQLDVRDELLEAGDQAPLQPPGRLPAHVRA
jgi:hypothetical protein